MSVRYYQDRIATLERAVRLVLALHEQGEQRESGLRLDPMAERQLRDALGPQDADSIMYQAGWQARRDGAPDPGEYCVEGDAYRAGWYDAEDEQENERAALQSMPRGFCTSGGGI